MKVSTLPPSRVLPAPGLTGWRIRRRILPLLLASLVTTTILQAQQPKPGDVTALDKQTLQLLLQRIDQLESRVRQLEAERQPAAVVSPAPGPTQKSAPPVNEAEQQAESQAESAVPERMDLSKTLLRLRGFGDITLHGDTRKGNTTAFTLGQLNLFVTSDISEKFKFLSEIVFEGGPDNIYGVTRGEINTFSVDVERYLVQYSYNDYLNVGAGRFHTAIGYYNTAYHHSTWFQTTTARPFLFQFEDRGGILPIHTVGVSAFGLIPSGRLGLHYVAEVGNGRASRSPLTQEPVQNVVDDQNHKAFNLALFARPEFVRPRFEWLNEALVVRHAIFGTSQVFNTPGFYTQFSRQLGYYRPYFRYQYINASGTEPVFPDVRLRQGPSVGLRYDASESVALKLQYDYTDSRARAAKNALALQVGFTF